MGLATYRQKRDFARTPEPAGKKPSAAKKRQLRFVVQKHAASHLHYDFRLEFDGVLKSWAIPKGPSMSAAQKRLAVQVEDHPLEYADFEGTIAKGEYGGGTVMLWDQGYWRPEGDVAAALRQGKLKFQLHGQRLHGGFNLVRLRARDAEPKQPNWLLIKEQDEQERDDQDDPVNQEATSVSTGRRMAEISAARGKQRREWHSAEPARASGGNAKSRKTRAPKPRTKMRLPRKLPRTIAPALATLSAKVPAGDNWIHEIKLDGYRVLAIIQSGHARLMSRNDKDWSRDFGLLGDAFAALSVDSAILDGEVCVFQDDGTTSFQELQRALSEGDQAAMTYVAFDLLYLNGQDLRALPTVERKRQLVRVLDEVDDRERIRFSDHVVGSGPEFFDHACRFGLEGIVSKLANAPYVEGRGKNWLKIKCHRTQEVVIGGFTAPSGSRHGFGALLVGTFDEQQALHYAGKVGTGFSGPVLQDLDKRLRALQRTSSPFSNAPRAPRVTWVTPKLVAQVRFSDWTRDGRMRHPAFLGLRADKDAREVRREREMQPEASVTQVSVINGPTSDTRRLSPSRGTASTRPTAATTSRSDESPTTVAGVTISHPERVLDAASGLTKLALARYFDAVAPELLKYAAGRPLALVRCPDGTHGKCFFQKHRGPGMAASIELARLAAGDEVLNVNSREGLVALAQHGVVELHGWGATLPDAELPDWFVLDLDPDERLPFDTVVDAALELRALLAERELESWVKTTGGKGLHVVVPLRREYSWSSVKDFTKAIAVELAARSPERYTATLSKAARTGKIFIDYLRNGRGATAILPYAPHARPGSPVAMPIAWSELKRVKPADFTVANVVALLKRRRRDPWAALLTTPQKLVLSKSE